MVYLTIAIVVLGLVLWKTSSRTAPHHTFFVSLLPLLDIEHSAGTHCDFEQNSTNNAMAA